MLIFYLSFIDNSEDKSKFEKLYYLYKDQMHYYANSVLHDEYEAEDAVHNAMINIAKNIDRIDDPDDTRTRAFIITIAKNTAIDILRKKNRSQTVTLDEAYMKEDNSEMLEDVFCSKENFEMLKNKILELDDIYRDVLSLQYLNGLSHKEIAKALNRKETTVKQQSFRGKQKLIAAITKEIDDDKYVFQSQNGRSTEKSTL